MFKDYTTLVPHLKQYKYRYIAGILCLIAVDAGQVLIPRYLKTAIDTIVGGSFRITDIVRPLLVMLLLALLISVGRFFWRYFINIASRRIEAEMRERLFSHILMMSGGFFRDNTTGDLMARATNDISTVRQATGMGFVALVDGVFMTAMILVAMFANNASVAAWIVIPLPLITALILLFGKIVGKLFKRIQDIYGRLSNIAQESLAGVRVVKSFVKEHYFFEKFEVSNIEYKNAIMDLVKTFGFFFPFITFLSGLSTVLLILFGGKAVINNKMTPGSIIAMLSYLEMLVWPMMSAGFTVNIVQRGAASMKRINEILSTKPEIPQSLQHTDQKPRGDIEIRDLDYTYPGAETPSLRHIYLRIPEGTIVGILGKVGSGKSTILKILPRMLDAGEGHVFIGGIDSCSFNLKELRAWFGMVPQESFLFSESIRNNILFSAREVSDERFEEVVRIAGLDRDLHLFPDGWNTIVGERGITLSGGQKQRIALARALVIDPPVLLLDDALSAVDAETEERILRALLKERQGKTTVIVSHRISTLRNADQIIVLDCGEIVQRGTHESLMAEQEGFYARIAALQQLEQQSCAACEDAGQKEEAVDG
jgi:ATP-binding cassette subfamily B protein